jgi:hypothetical protein
MSKLHRPCYLRVRLIPATIRGDDDLRAVGAPLPVHDDACWKCSALGVDERQAIARQPDPRCPCAVKFGVEVGQR